MKLLASETIDIRPSLADCDDHNHVVLSVESEALEYGSQFAVNVKMTLAETESLIEKLQGALDWQRKAAAIARRTTGDKL